MPITLLYFIVGHCWINNFTRQPAQGAVLGWLPPHPNLQQGLRAKSCLGLLFAHTWHLRPLTFPVPDASRRWFYLPQSAPFGFICFVISRTFHIKKDCPTRCRWCIIDKACVVRCSDFPSAGRSAKYYFPHMGRQAWSSRAGSLHLQPFYSPHPISARLFSFLPRFYCCLRSVVEPARYLVRLQLLLLTKL